MKIFKLKDISEFIRNGVTIKQDISSKEGIPITRIETISKGTIDFNKLGYANIFKIEKYKEWLLKKGDILISHINSEKHLGKSAIYLDNNYDIIHGMNLLCIRAIDKKVFPEYLQLFFKTNQYKKQIKKITKKSVNQASFSVNDFKEILITGGESLLNPEWQEIVAICVQKGFRVTLFTNGTLLDERAANFLAQFTRAQLKEVQFSLYALEGTIHDSITKMKGSSL